ncbi:endonuclease/exonuclease/phosphatase family protein [Sulfitobacter sp.]|uniref:endonuclease/exonuclease/phosphatase family protein n=1 Tax=Sulfitobacter sp. TaxID=1903071 RepID=UPI0030011EE8
MIDYFKWLLYGLTAILVAATLLPFSRARFGAIRGLAFPRVQLFWMAVGLIVASFAVPKGDWLALLLALVALVQLAHIVKFTPIWSRQSVDADVHLKKDSRCHVSLLAANIKKSNRDYTALVDLACRYNPDIVMVIEVDGDWIAALEGRMKAEYPHWISVPKETGYGMCVMSRLPLSGSQVREIVMDGVPSVRTTVTLGTGAQLRLYVVHPEPPAIDHDTKGRDSEIAHIGMEAAHDPLPAIVTGDLNDVAWSTTTRSFQRLSVLLDPRVGRGFFNTFSAFHWWARWPLDHLFHDPQFRLISMARLEKIGSDHFPMLFKLALAEDPAQNSETGTVDVEEKTDIRGMIEQERKRERYPIGTDWED